MNDFKHLFDRYIDGHLTKDELSHLFEEIGADESAVPPLLDELLRSGSVKGLANPAREEVLFRQIMEKDRASRRRTVVRRIQWAAAAASVLILLTTALLFYNRHQSGVAHPGNVTTGQIVAVPGKKGAVLTLSNGQTVSLDTLGNGTIAQQNGQAILLSNGSLSYQGNNTAVVYNTLSTARGREFQLLLPDGSKVWLNAASSIRYPTMFNGDERRVEITGEAYFEIAKNENQPFIVSLNGGSSTVKVLGTHFNVNAYADEKILRATLAEGAVRVTTGSLDVRLYPGQQARISRQHIQVTDVNVEQTLAWKDGLFSFKDMPFDEVMRQLSRWYDVEVVYDNGVPDINFEGELGRDVSLSKILFFLERVGVHYRIENGKTIVISK